ncbi:MAG: ribose-phosphate diphosphokinase [Spirochaetia bacterium]
MSFSKPASLGVIACPGAEHFTNEVIGHLKRIYLRIFDKKAERLSHRYSLEKSEIIRRINLASDMRTSGSPPNAGTVDAYRPPDFKIPAAYTCFANGEVKAEIQRSVRGMNLYIVQDVENHTLVRVNSGKDEMKFSINDHIFSLLVTIDAAIQGGAKEVTVVLPVYPYSRQHKKKGREGLTAARFGQMLENLGVKRLITLDIHSKEISNSFNHLRLENLHASYQILKKLRECIDLKTEDIVVVSPDTGAVDRNKFYAESLHKPLALLYKERDYSKLSQNAADNNITTIKLLGDVKGKTVIMADDMLGTGGTLIKAMELLKKKGAEKIICVVSLPFFTGSAREHFETAYQKGLFFRVLGTNAVYHDDTLLAREWYISANVTNLFARTIQRLHHNLSLSPLLDNRQIIHKLLD